MKVKIDERVVQLKNSSNVFDALDALKINPENVLVKKKNQLIPHDALLKDGDSLELITVISGG